VKQPQGPEWQVDFITLYFGKLEQYRKQALLHELIGFLLELIPELSLHIKKPDLQESFVVDEALITWKFKKIDGRSRS